ncbi:MAG TPA: hydrogenase maturation protease [Acidimicrobiales bacterium]|nr:hydrogenase maturation protease [Acidimicrobiales bacterium]
MGTYRAIVIGYGNSLWGDDGVGQVVAQALWSQRDGPGPYSGATIIWAEQLVPELAQDVSNASVAIFVDAACDGRPAGTVTARGVDAQGVARSPGGANLVSVGCWEDLAPASLLALCADLYGRVPAAAFITVSVDPPTFGAGLSAPVVAAVPAAVAAAWSAIGACGAPSTLGEGGAASFAQPSVPSSPSRSHA